MTDLSRWSRFLAFVLTLGLAAEASGQVTPPVPRPVRKGRKYTVKIDSSPQQAAIYLDDKQYGIVGYTPYSGKLVKGDYKLVIELQGYKPSERIIRVDRTSKDFFVPLEKQVMPGTVDVQAAADPSVLGAQVFVDGQLEGTAPIPVDVPAGRHLVEIKKSGYADYSQWVTLREGERVTIAPVLKAAVVETPKGSLLVDADVDGAEVSVDGRVQPDTTPTIVDGLDEGVHIVEVKKPPAVPWKQTVYVKGGQRTKVTATLAATLQHTKGGNVRVVSNVADAEVWLDGAVKGKAPLDLADVPVGVHIVEVRAKGYASKEEKVTVNAGQATILKIDLVPAAGAAKTGRIKIVSPVPEAKAFIDGADAGPVPVDKEVSAGEHFVTVQKDGYAKFEKKVPIEVGQTVTITAELKSIGGLRFLANVDQADVFLDGEAIGKTPMVKEDVAVGEHVVTIRKGGYYDHEMPVKVEGGKLAIISAELKIIDTGPTPEEVQRAIRGLSSYGARVMPYGRFTTDGGVGYPYLLQFRGTVGVMDTPRFGWDISVGFRSYLTTWEFLGTARARFFQRTPFAMAGFATLGGGGGFAGRNNFIFQAGALSSITFNNLVTVTGRGYVDLWSDRLCGAPERGDTDGIPDNGPRVCTTAQTPEDRTRAGELLGKTVATAMDLQERDFGLRLMLSVVVEAALLHRISAFLIFEGAPFQSERAAHTDLFNEQLLEKDPIYNGTVGITAKF